MHIFCAQQATTPAADAPTTSQADNKDCRLGNTCTGCNGQADNEQGGVAAAVAEVVGCAPDASAPHAGPNDPVVGEAWAARAEEGAAQALEVSEAMGEAACELPVAVQLSLHHAAGTRGSGMVWMPHTSCDVRTGRILINLNQHATVPCWMPWVGCNLPHSFISLCASSTP
jgi:hypothetical protein